MIAENGQSFGWYNLASSTYITTWITPPLGYISGITVHPTTGELYASSAFGIFIISTPPPPPPVPPAAPPSPPAAPPPGPAAPLPVQSFFSILSCPGVAHHLSAAAGPIADLVPGGGWTGTAVEAGPGAPLSTYNKPMVVGQDPSLQLSNIDPFDSLQRAWVFRGPNGVRLAPGGGTTVGGPAGFSLAVWFRLDDSDWRTSMQNIVMELVLDHPGGGTVTLILTTRFAYGWLFLAPIQAVWCCGPGGTTTTSDMDYVVSESDYQFDPYPNGGQFSIGVWQHVVATFDGTGSPVGFFWNGVEQMMPGSNGASEHVSFAPAVVSLA